MTVDGLDVSVLTAWVPKIEQRPEARIARAFVPVNCRWLLDLLWNWPHLLHRRAGINQSLPIEASYFEGHEIADVLLKMGADSTSLARLRLPVILS